MDAYLQKLDRWEGVVQDKMPFALSIAGLDPTGGAGLLADIKTMQSQEVYGLGVLSCNTVQTDQRFDRIHWESEDFIIESIKALFSRFAIQAVKIGVVQNREMLSRLLCIIHGCCPEVQVVWDPVVRPTAGGRFFELTKADLAGRNAAQWKTTLNQCTVVTPNAEEAVLLGGLLGLVDERDTSMEVSLQYLDPLIQQISRHTAVLLKGGHLMNSAPDDWLYDYETNTRRFQKRCLSAKVANVGGDVSAEVYNKHGSGCVHSSIVAASLAKGNSLPVAAQTAKTFMESFLRSSQGLLGVH